MKSNAEFSAILADPAWRYGTGKTALSSCEPHYATMSIEEICAMPVPQLCAKDCLLFLWATSPMLPGALEVMKAWGFNYVNVAFTWVKLHPSTGKPCLGLGYYTRSNAEYVLLGKKGTYPPMNKGVSSVVLAPRGAHSRKPQEIHERVEALVGQSASKLELFARERVEGWTQSGLELNGCDYRAGDLIGIQEAPVYTNRL